MIVNIMRSHTRFADHLTLLLALFCIFMLGVYSYLLFIHTCCSFILAVYSRSLPIHTCCQRRKLNVVSLELN